jgi:phospholipid/cholesterol/gamma-HCH transport system permease protein
MPVKRKPQRKLPKMPGKSSSDSNSGESLIIEPLGHFVRYGFIGSLRYLRFVLDALRNSLAALQCHHLTVEQMHRIGITSLPLVITTSVFTGSIMSWQLAYQFAGMIPLTYVGMAVGKSVMTELAPILTAMVLAGRIGASMCSELGTMAVTEQLDAYNVLGMNPYKFLIVPRITATVIMIPILTILSIFVGLMGGFVVVYLYRDVSFHTFFSGVRLSYKDWDFAVGIIKAALFGFFISSYACYFGYYTVNGAEGVGKSTKATVVFSMTSILIGGFALSKLLLI